MNRGDLLYAFTKINLWRLTQFRKVVYIDADIVALRAPDELFDLQAPFAAVPDVGWPDAFNSGLMALTPHMGDYWALQTLATSGDSFDGADQGLLNQYYEHKDWHRLSFTYNCTPNANYQYEPAYRYYKSGISLVHFIGKNKPWLDGRTTKGTAVVYRELLNRWWAVYDRHFKSPVSIHPCFSKQRANSELMMQSTSGQYRSGTNLVQSYVKGETTALDNSSSIKSLGTASTSTEPEAPITTSELSLTDSGDAAETIIQGNVEPTPTVEQRRFSAPQSGWDATR